MVYAVNFVLSITEWKIAKFCADNAVLNQAMLHTESTADSRKSIISCAMT